MVSNLQDNHPGEEFPLRGLFSSWARFHFYPEAYITNHSRTQKPRPVVQQVGEILFGLTDYFAFLVTTDLMTNRVAIIRTMAIGRTTIQLRMKPAIM